ncbi:MAG: hypothetical protein QOK42_1050 [Frankiaceae bacterium]|nr:hypothetical protein [Frankiaceae bacterium]
MSATPRRFLAVTTVAGLAALLATTPGGAAQHYWTGDDAAIARAKAANGPSIDSAFRLEGSPRTSRAAMAALANDPPHVDPAAFNLAAWRAAQSLGTVGGAWKQVGPKAGYLEDPNRGEGFDGRMPGTGIVLSMASDPRDTTGKTVFAGTGGGLWKTTNGGTTWTYGAGIPAVPIGGVGVDPSNPNYVYAGTGQAFQGGGEGGGLGVFVSKDGGKTFTRPVSNVRGNGAQEVTVSSAGVAFVATSGGLFRSTDHGVHWEDVRLPTNAAGTAPATGTPVGSWTSDVKVRPGHPNEVYAAVGYVAGQIKTPDGVNAAPGNNLYRSFQSGKPGSWVRADVKSPTGWEQSPDMSTDPIGRTKLAFSPDGVTLWALVADAGNRSAKTVGDQAIPAGVGHDTSLNGIYRTDVGGLESNLVWVFKGNSKTLLIAPGGSQPVLSAANALGYNPGIQAWYNGWIAVNPVDPTQIFLGEEEVYASVANTGASTPAEAVKPLVFKVIDRYLSPCALTGPQVCPPGTPYYSGTSTHPDQHAGLPLATGANHDGVRLWVGNDGGFFHQDAHSTTDDAGFDNDSWTTGGHVNTLLPYRAVKGSDGSVIAGLQDNGTVKYYPGDGVGVEICGGDGSGVAIARDRPNVFYCQANGSLSVTTDGGKTTSDAGAPAAPAFAPAVFSMDPTNDDELIIGDTSVYQTVKGAASGSSDWVTVFANPTQNGGQAATSATDTYGNAAYESFAFFDSSSVKASESATDRGLATNVKAGCDAKAASSACWHAAKLKGMPVRQIQALAINPANVKQVYLATGIASVVRYDFGGVTAPRILLSSDAGETVKDVSGNLPRGNYWDVKVFNKRVYVAGDFGVFSAPVGSSRWSRFGTGMPVTRVFGLSVSGDRTEIVASTYGLGVWTLKASSKPVTLPKPPVKTGNLGGSYGGGKPPNTGGLATTGLGAGTPVLALGLLGLAALTWRRRRLSQG